MVSMSYLISVMHMETHQDYLVMISSQGYLDGFHGITDISYAHGNHQEITFDDNQVILMVLWVIFDICC